MKLTVPMVLSSLATIIYNMADTFFVGMLNDPIQSAAVSLAAPLMLAFNVVSNLFGTGTSSMMSRSLGAKDYKAVRQSSSFGFYSTLFFGLLFSILYVAFRHPLLGILGVRQETEAVTNDYLFWIVALGALPSILHMVMMQIVRSEGSSVIASLGIAIGCVTNIRGKDMERLFEKDSTMEERFGKCPYATAQSLISGKWAVLIMHYLEDGPIRFNDLLRLMPKMIHATLSVQLKALVDNGLVERKQYESIPPKVEYSLTEIGKKFHPVIEALQNWGQEYIEFLQKDK